MLTKSQVLLKHFGVEDFWEAQRLYLFSPAINKPIDQYCQSLKLPYTAPEHPLIPTFEEIEIAMKENRLMQSNGLFPVCRVRDCVVKYGYNQAIFQEAENLLFLQKHSQVRAPKLYAAFTREVDIKPVGKRDCYYMVTEYIEGKALTAEWDTLDQIDRDLIGVRLVEQLQLLRSVPSPFPTYYGRVHHQAWSPSIQLCCTEGEDLCGPHNSYEDLTSAMYTCAELQTAMSYNKPDYFDKDRSFLSQLKPMLEGVLDRTPILTHFDLKFDNIIVQSVRENEQVKDWKVTLIDWETLGWAPPYMQAMNLNLRFFSFSCDNEGQELREAVKARLGTSDSWKPLLDFLRQASDVYP